MKMILTDRRKSLEPFHVEMLIFLNYNKELWTEATMEDILSAPAEPLVADDEEEDDSEGDQEEEEQEEGTASEPDDEDDEN